jgi:ribose transport system permease protein
VRRSALVDGFGRYGLAIVLAATIVVFCLIDPGAFAQWGNFRSTFDQQSVVVLVGFAAMVTLIVGEFDLSVGANAGLANIFVVGLAHDQGLPWELAFVASVAISTLIGLINGLIVSGLGVNAFVATLGTGTILGGIGLVYTHQADITSAPSGLTHFGRAAVGPLPLSACYAAVIAIALLVVLQWLPVGRRMAAVGANRRAAELTGIPIPAHLIGAFAAGGLLAGLAGAMFGAQLGTATNGSGTAFLLPAFAAAFLGSTAFSPGRFNVLGTITAVLLLAFLVSGLEIAGVQPWVEPIVNGAALIVAVGASAWAQRLRIARLRREQLDALARRDPRKPSGWLVTSPEANDGGRGT